MLRTVIEENRGNRDMREAQTGDAEQDFDGHGRLKEEDQQTRVAVSDI